MTYDYSGTKVVDDINTIYITGGGLVHYPFRGISTNSPMGWQEVVWGASLTRSSNFELTNIDDVNIGYVRQVEVTFPLMTMKDFLALQKVLHERYCTVDAYYVDDGERHSCEMSITNNERKKIYSFGTSIIGMLNVTVKFVATNRDNEDTGSARTIQYNANGGVGQEITNTTEFGEQVRLLGQTTFTYGTKHIEYWCTSADGTGSLYLPTQSITISDSLVLYAIWSD